MKQLVKKALRLRAKAILAGVIQEYIATSPAVWFNPYLSAKVRPYRPEVETYIIRRDDVARPVTTAGAFIAHPAQRTVYGPVLGSGLYIHGQGPCRYDQARSRSLRVLRR